MEALPVQDQRAHLLGQARCLADKMDQQAKLAQETTRKRDQLREELVTVYVREATEGAIASAKDTCGYLIRRARRACTGTKAQEGDREAQ
eukprot:2009656-Amphidinium_carterae.1